MRVVRNEILADGVEYRHVSGSIEYAQGRGSEREEARMLCFLRSWLVFAALIASGIVFMPPANAQNAGGSAFEREVFRLTNQARLSGIVCGGVRRPATHALIWNSGLARAARQWSRHLASTGRLSHDRMRQRIQAVRLKACGKRLNWGENVAYNQSPQRVVQRWLRSPGHCKNIMNPQFRMMGVGMVQKGTRQYYTQLFHSSPGC